MCSRATVNSIVVPLQGVAGPGLDVDSGTDNGAAVSDIGGPVIRQLPVLNKETSAVKLGPANVESRHD